MTHFDFIFEKSFVDGQWLADSDSKFNVIDPATGNSIFQVFDGGTYITEIAILVAHKAFPAWRGKIAKIKVFYCWKTLIT